MDQQPRLCHTPEGHRDEVLKLIQVIINAAMQAERQQYLKTQPLKNLALSLRAVERKGKPRVWLRVAFIPEKRLYPGRLVHERQFVHSHMWHALRRPSRVAPGLFCHSESVIPTFFASNTPTVLRTTKSM